MQKIFSFANGEPGETVANLNAYPQGGLEPEKKIAGVAGVILAGGNSSRMGRNKALLDYQGEPLIQSIYRTMAGLFDQVAVITNTPEEYGFLPCPKVPDIHAGAGSIAGIHAGLSWSPEERIFVVGCDMPFLEQKLVRWLAARLGNETALVPQSPGGFEPMHSFYSRSALPQLTEALQSGRKRIIDLLELISVKVIPANDIAVISPGFRSFVNLNTPEDCRELL